MTLVHWSSGGRDGRRPVARCPVGKTDPEWVKSSRPSSCRWTGPGLTRALDRIARFKRSKFYRVVDDLPRNNYGKVLKTELWRRLEEER
jgi:acyl-CoA synthetase (AMP-forming)/AMP-acid ligase II